LYYITLEILVNLCQYGEDFLLVEQADKLAKVGNDLPYRSPTHPHRKAHPTPYYFYKNEGYTPDNGPIRHLQTYLIKYDKIHNLKKITEKFLNIHRWTNDKKYK
jgi:hypothetical protein